MNCLCSLLPRCWVVGVHLSLPRWYNRRNMTLRMLPLHPVNKQAIIFLSQVDSLRELWVSRYAIELIMNDVSFNYGTWVANAFLLHLQDMGFLRSNLNVIITDKLHMVRHNLNHVQNHEHIICISVNCRVGNDTLPYKEITNEKKLYKFERNRALPDFHLIRTRKVNTSLIKLSLTLVLFKQSMMLLFKKNTTA